MELITSAEFKIFCNRSDLHLLKTTYDRPKLYETTDEMIKIFYPRRKRFSSNNIKPYAIRFCNHANQLRQYGFVTPIIKDIKHCDELNTHIVTYDKLPGENVRVLATMGHLDILKKAAVFITELHHKGIFFRSIHLENLLYLENGQFALLDIVDVTYKSKPLNIYYRYRNLKHMFLIKEDKEIWDTYGVQHFMQHYNNASQLSHLSKKILSMCISAKCS